MEHNEREEHKQHESHEGHKRTQRPIDTFKIMANVYVEKKSKMFERNTTTSFFCRSYKEVRGNVLTNLRIPTM